MGNDAIIVGGSIAGLMCGIMLKHHGYNVIILEKDSGTIREDYNAGISIGPPVLDFLSKHSRVLKDMTITCNAPVKFNMQGKPKPEHKQTMTSTNWALFVAILRANFDGLVSKAVPTPPQAEKGDGTVSFRAGVRVTNVEETGQDVQVHFEDVNTLGTHTLTSSLVIVADGSTSALREILLPDVKRQYAGYVSWRGTIDENSVDSVARTKYAGKLDFHRMDRSYILHYTIPTEEGSLEPGRRLHNWIWYQWMTEGTDEENDIFTDINGTKHVGTVPRGMIRPEVWEKQKSLASSTMPAELAHILQRTPKPMVTKIYDLASSKAVFFGGKLFLVGDAQYTIRPNAGQSTTHAAYDCNMLEQVIQKKLSPSQWEKAVLRYAAAQQRFGMAISAFGLDSKLIAIWNAIRWLLLLLGQKLRLV